MNQHEAHDTLEHQRLVARCHGLIAAIASRPGGTKLLRGILPVLEQYAAYKKRKA